MKTMRMMYLIMYIIVNYMGVQAGYEYRREVMKNRPKTGSNSKNSMSKLRPREVLADKRPNHY